MFNFSVNQGAVKIIEEKIIPEASKLRVGILKSDNGANIIDMGINFPGDWLAGKLFVEAGLGGLGKVNFQQLRIKGNNYPAIQVLSSQPVIAEMASHVAFWRLQDPDSGETITISGPIRAIKGADIYARAVDYRDPKAKKAVACIQIDRYPSSSLIEKMANEAGLKPKDLYILLAPTASLVGSVQVPARTVEQGLPALYDQGFNLSNIVQAYGIAPVPPIAESEIEAYGLVNDCLIYGNDTILYVDCEDEEITSIIDDLTFIKNKGGVYGLPFKEIFASCDNDWSKVPREWDAPARVTFHNMRTGHSFTSGKIDEEMLVKTLFMG